MTAQPFDTILHIGCGTGEATLGWLNAGAQRVVLVEPNPAHGPGLSRLSARYPQVEVIEAAVAAKDGEGLLRVFNLARHSSLSGAAGLPICCRGCVRSHWCPSPLCRQPPC